MRWEEQKFKRPKDCSLYLTRTWSWPPFHQQLLQLKWPFVILAMYRCFNLLRTPNLIFASSLRLPGSFLLSTVLVQVWQLQKFTQILPFKQVSNIILPRIQFFTLYKQYFKNVAAQNPNSNYVPNCHKSLCTCTHGHCQISLPDSESVENKRLRWSSWPCPQILHRLARGRISKQL